MHELRFSPQALDDLRGIRDYIANELDSPIAAGGVITDILHRLDILTRHPRAGESLNAVIGLDTDYRRLTCKNHLAFYRFDEHSVYIVRILRGNQDWLERLFGAIMGDTRTEEKKE